MLTIANAGTDSDGDYRSGAIGTTVATPNGPIALTNDKTQGSSITLIPNPNNNPSNNTSPPPTAQTDDNNKPKIMSNPATDSSVVNTGKVTSSTDGTSKTITNSAGQEVQRRLVNNQDELLNEAEKAAGGSLDSYTEIKPGWYVSQDGKTKIEWSVDGHYTTDEGPHVTVRKATEDGGWKVVDKIFVKGHEQFKKTYK
ncbi:MAG: hypothetical protein LLG02_07460 [Pelosinus sp.]|nr:hypothetical protein [Pelosinus sp.]